MLDEKGHHRKKTKKYMKENVWTVVDNSRRTILDNLSTVGSNGVVYTDLDYIISCRQEVENALDDLIGALEETNFDMTRSEDPISKEVDEVSIDMILRAMSELLETLDERYDYEKCNYFIYRIQIRLAAYLRMFNC